jgi:hypothetical protein
LALTTVDPGRQQKRKRKLFFYIKTCASPNGRSTEAEARGSGAPLGLLGPLYPLCLLGPLAQGSMCRSRLRAALGASFSSSPCQGPSIRTSRSTTEGCPRRISSATSGVYRPIRQLYGPQNGNVRKPRVIGSL